MPEHGKVDSETSGDLSTSKEPEVDEILPGDDVPSPETQSKDNEEDSDTAESNAVQAAIIGLVFLMVFLGIIFFFHAGGRGRRSAAVSDGDETGRLDTPPRSRSKPPVETAGRASRRAGAGSRRGATSVPNIELEPYTRITTSGPTSGTQSTARSAQQGETAATERVLSLSSAKGTTVGSTAGSTTNTASTREGSESTTASYEDSLSTVVLPPVPRKTRPLVCVTRQVGKRASVPEDGLCDFAIFHDITLGDGQWVPATSRGRLHSFLDKSSRSKHSVYMLSFPANIYRQVKSLLRSKEASLQLISKYLGLNIRGYGFALIERDVSSFGKEASQYTEIIKDLSNRMRAAVSSGGITFVGLLLRGNGNGSVGNEVKDLIRSTDVFIAVSHTPLPRTSSNCLVQPIGSWSSYHLNDITLQTVSAALTLIQKGATTNTTVFALSSSLGVLKFNVHSDSYKGVEGIWNIKCTNVSLEPLENECTQNMMTGTIGRTDYIVYDYDQTGRIWRSYETASSLRSKMEKVFDVLRPGRSSALGWALYDVDMEDQKGTCNSSLQQKQQNIPSNRLHLVKELLVRKNNVSYKKKRHW